MVVPKPKEERTSQFRRNVESWIMVALAGHVIETRYLKDLSTGPSSDLRNATLQATWYVSQWAMGPTKMVWPLRGGGEMPPPPFVTAANELLEQLYAETERLVLQKMTAVHYVARALIERDELIGDELEEVFQEAEAVDPTLAQPYERRLLQFRDFSPRPEPHVAGEWEPKESSSAAASGGQVEPGAADGDWPEPPDGWLGEPPIGWTPPAPAPAPEG
jgi:cell division protease FtsH